MHIYAYGSLCRGEYCQGSDLDLLAISDRENEDLDLMRFSVYTSSKISDLWERGNPFAWHLSLEARLLFTSDGTDFLSSLGRPRPYRHFVEDCEKFLALFREAADSAVSASEPMVFDLGVIFLAVRNIATCFALGVMGCGKFSRDAARQLGPKSVPVGDAAYRILERARLLSSRGFGDTLSLTERRRALETIPALTDWMFNLVDEAKSHARIQ